MKRIVPPILPKPNTCGACQHWTPWPRQFLGTCGRYPIGECTDHSDTCDEFADKVDLKEMLA